MLTGCPLPWRCSFCRAGAAPQAASGSRSWCRRRGHTARPWRPARGRWSGRRRAAPRTAAAVPRSAGPSPGRARSPPNQSIEHRFESESRTLHSPNKAAHSRGGPHWGRNSAEPGGQQRTAGDNKPRGQRPFHSDAPGPRKSWTALSHGRGHRFETCHAHQSSPQVRAPHQWSSPTARTPAGGEQAAGAFSAARTRAWVSAGTWV